MNLFFDSSRTRFKILTRDALAYGVARAFGQLVKSLHEARGWTLRDGTYDEATQTLAIASPKAAMHVDARDIVKREEAPAESDPPKEKPASPRTVPTPSGLAAEIAAHDQRIAALKGQAQPLLDEYNKAMADIADKDADFALSWVSRADLSPAAVPDLGSDPLVSQVKHKEDIEQLNSTLAALSGIRTEYQKPEIRASTDPNTGRHIVREFKPEDYAQVAKRKAEQKSDLVKATLRFMHSPILPLYLETHH